MKPQAGDIGFGVIPGAPGAFVALGQLILADASRYTHAYVVTGPRDEPEQVDMLVEAMPSGARVWPMAGRVAPRYRYARVPMTDGQRAAFVAAAGRYVGRGYGFSTYLYLAAAQWGLPRALLRKRVSNNGRMICSQLVDQALADAGVHLFDDGRIPQDVTPGDLLYALQVMPGVHFFDWKAGEA